MLELDIEYYAAATFGFLLILMYGFLYFYYRKISKRLPGAGVRYLSAGFGLFFFSRVSSVAGSWIAVLIHGDYAGEYLYMYVDYPMYIFQALALTVFVLAGSKLANHD